MPLDQERIAELLPDNTTEQISPADLRESFAEVGDAYDGLSITSIRAVITDDAGDGSVASDCAASNFAGNAEPDPAPDTFIEISDGSLVTFFHKGMTYFWAGPSGVTLGLGGSYVPTSEEFASAGPTDSIKWKGNWSAGAYKQFDFVYASSWAMIANVDTSDPAAPSAGAYDWAFYATDPPPSWGTGSTEAVQLLTGVRIQETEAIEVDVLRVWIPAIDPGIRYAILSVEDGGNPTYEDIFPTETGWHYISNFSALFFGGVNVDVYLVTQGAGTSSTQFNGSWNYRQTGASPSPSNPAAYQRIWWFNVNAPDTIYWNVYDETETDRSADIGTLVAGDKIRIEYTNVGSDPFIEWTLLETPDFYVQADTSLNMYDLSVSPIQTVTDGEQSWRNVIATHYESQPLGYVLELGKYDGNDKIKGLLGSNGLESVLETDDGYGIDVYYRVWTKSPDWDIVAHSTVDASSAASARAASVGETDYKSGKAVDVLDIAPDPTWTPVVAVTDDDLMSGTYEVGLAVHGHFARANNSARLRFRLDAGDWVVFSREAKDANDTFDVYYAFPIELTGGTHAFEVEAQKTSGNDQFDIYFADVWFDRKA